MIRSEKRSEKNIRRMITCLLTLAMLLGVVTIVAARIEWPTRIEQFEKYSPVYTESVETGTPEEDLGLPESLRAVTSLDELELDQNAFVQAEPESQEWESYGYTEPENADALYEAGELAVYTLEQEDGSLAYRVYGSLDGSENRWFATDEDGSLTGVVQEVPVTWSGTYDPDQAGEYTFTASFSGYTYGSARPTAVITVQEGDAGEEEGGQTGLAYEGNEATIETADTQGNGSGIEISLYDYDTALINRVNGTQLGSDTDNGTNWFVFAGSVNGSTQYQPSRTLYYNLASNINGVGGGNQGIVEDVLGSDGYPVLADAYLPISQSQSLAALFSDLGYSAVDAREKLTGLFTYDEDSKEYRFDASENFATINPNGDGNYEDAFTVFARPNGGAGTNVWFFPFDSIDIDNTEANYHYGMKITMDFLMPPDGEISTSTGSEDMVFEFNGDDDVWVFIDDVLILDLGGSHAAVSGRINFAEGTVTVDRVARIDGEYANSSSAFLTDQVQYIGDLLYEARQNDVSWVTENLYTAICDSNCPATNCPDPGNTTHWFLKDIRGTDEIDGNYSTHSFSMFYLERGAGSANCAITFNLLLAEELGVEVPVEKTLVGWEEGDDDYNFYYDVTLMDKGDDGQYVEYEPEEPEEGEEEFDLREHITAEVTHTVGAGTGEETEEPGIVVPEETETEDGETVRTGTGSGQLTITFDETMWGQYGEESTYYFKVSETGREQDSESSEDYVIYDESYYIVEVTVSRDDNGVYSSAVTSIVKYNEDNTDENGEVIGEIIYTLTEEEVAEGDLLLSFTNSLTASITILKKGAEDEALEGARFYLYYEENDEESDERVRYYYQLGDDGQINWIAESDISETDNPTELISDADGRIYIPDLRMDRAGGYYLEEIETPDGYQLMEEERIYISFGEDTTLEAVYDGYTTSLVDKDTGEIEIVNYLDGVISGMPWVDSDGDGTQNELDEGEDAGMDNMRVYLMQKIDGDGYCGSGYDYVTNSSGDPVYVEIGSTEEKTYTFTEADDSSYTITARSTETEDESGYPGYEFSGLQPGTYGVMFVSDYNREASASGDNRFPLGQYYASTQNVGETTGTNDDTTDSDASAFFTDEADYSGSKTGAEEGDTGESPDTGSWLAFTMIKEIELSSPSADETGEDEAEETVPYRSENNDSGFVPRKGSITITKTDEDGTGLNDVEFKLERLISGGVDDDSAEWETIAEGNETANTTATIENEDGKLVYENLDPGTYRLTEISSTGGYSLLAEPVYIKIPYDDGDTYPEIDEPAKTDPSYMMDETSYWLNLGYNITNQKIFLLPESGGLGAWQYLVIGLAVAAAGGSGAGISRARRRKRVRALRKELDIR